MTQSNPAVRDELSRLRSEHEFLSREAGALRRFCESMTKLIEAVEAPRRDAETLELLEQMLDDSILAIGAVDGSLLVPDDATQELVFVLVRGESPQRGLVGRRLPAGQGIAGWVATHRRATIVNNVPIDDRFYPELDVEFHYKTNSLLAAPIIGGGKVLGVVEVINKRDGKLFSTGNQTLLTLMCRFAGELLHSLISDVDLTQSGRRARQA